MQNIVYIARAFAKMLFVTLKLFALVVASMVECALHQKHAHVHLDGQAMIAGKVKALKVGQNDLVRMCMYTNFACACILLNCIIMMPFLLLHYRT